MNSDSFLDIKGQLVKAGISNESVAAKYAENLINEGFDSKKAFLTADDGNLKECRIRTGHRNLINKFIVEANKEKYVQSQAVATTGHQHSIKLRHSSILEATENLCDKRKLGKGAFAVVYVGEKRLIANHGSINRNQIEDWPARFAVKVAIIKSEDGGGGMTTWMAAADESELSILSKYSHRNICCLLGYSIDGPSRCLVFELCTGGDLQARLDGTAIDPGTKVPWPPLTSEHRIVIFAELARALEYLHNGCIPTAVHRAVKPQNELLDTEGHVKLAEFVTVRQDEAVSSKSNTSTAATHMSTKMVVGTFGFMPPEYTGFGHVSDKTDA
jgi:hypothetical protein